MKIFAVIAAFCASSDREQNRCGAFVNACKIFAVIAVMALVINPAARADDQETFLFDFLSGPYEIIGKSMDSGKAYIGNLIIEKADGDLKITRTIGNRVATGIGRIETGGPDRTKVLRIRFENQNQHYEGTFLIHSDLDNYGRLTGYLYLKADPAKLTGVEAWFRDHKKVRGK